MQAPGPTPAIEESPEPEIEESPEYVRTSLGAAIALGFSPGAFYRDARAYCVNLLLTYGDGCRANCAYCGLSRSRAGEYTDKSFIRVKWPVVRVSEVAERIGEIGDSAGSRGEVEVRRVCISMVTHPRAAADVVRVAMAIRSRSDVPISGLLTPTTLARSDLEAMKNAGIDRIGIAVDAATQGIFDVLRGHGVRGPHRWESYWKALAEAVEVFGRWMVGCHLIAGLGETEQEMAGAIQMAHDMGVVTHLFAFYPEHGSAMECHERPSLESYRRIQLARYLINEGIARCEDFSFDGGGTITGYGIPRDKLESVVGLGLPFITSGCPGKHGELGCNRPYANERPGEPIRNYPFPPDEQDIEEIRAQLGLSM
ncbi:MAG: radical SAM protein [Firmicutes bacterium]|nr:radical SAM protein [Bacillota bacterium]